MSTTLSKQKLELAFAEQLAARILAELRPACQRIQIVGSVRRQRRFVGDIELVALPRMRKTGLFGDTEASELEPLLARLVEERRLIPIKDGPKQKQYAVGRWPAALLDLFIVPADELDAWGMHVAVRTGPASFSNALVTYQGMRGRLGSLGLLPPDLLVRNGFQLWRVLAGQHDPKAAPVRRGETLRWFDDAEEEPATGEPLGCWCVRVPTPEEADVFAAFELTEIPPEERQ